MKFLLRSMIFLLISLQLSFCNYFKASKRDTVLKSAFQNLIVDNKLNGFLVCNLIAKNKTSEAIAKSKEILRRIGELTTIAQIDPAFIKNLHKFKRNFSRFPSTRSTLIQPHVVANDRVYNLLLVNSYFLEAQKALIKNIRYLNQHFSSVQGVSKMLIVAIVDKPFSRYGKLLRNVPVGKSYWYNIQILEVVTTRKRSVAPPNYKVIRFDYFRKVLKIARYSKNFKFFKDSMKNLRGMKLSMSHLNPKIWKSSSGSKYMVEVLKEHPIATAVRQLNGSVLSNLFEERNDSFIYVDSSNKVSIDRTSLYPTKFYLSSYIIPTLYDEIESVDVTQFFLNAIVIVFIIVVFRFYMKFFRLDPQTWQLVRTFSMIIGVSNPRNPVRFAETVSFMFLIAIGFFFGNDLIFGLFSTHMVENVERNLVTTSDVVQNNISFVFFDPREKEAFKERSNLTWSQRARADNNLFTNMLTHKNECLPTMIEAFGVSFPDRIVVNDVICARKSHIRSAYWMKFKWNIPRNCPWFHRLNDNLLRFYESQLDSNQRTLNIRSAIRRKYLERHIEKHVAKVTEERENETEELRYLLWIIAIGIFLPLLVLASEILMYRLSNL